VADVRDAIVKVQAIARALTGMREAPDDPRANMVAFPFAISYAGNGGFAAQAGVGKGMHHIVTDMHCAREADMAQAVQMEHAFLDDFANALLADPTLGGVVSTIVATDDNQVRYSFGPTNYCGVPTIVLRWDILVKIQNAIT
jgi:hypothetical protein